MRLDTNQLNRLLALGFLFAIIGIPTGLYLKSEFSEPLTRYITESLDAPNTDSLTDRLKQEGLDCCVQFNVPIAALRYSELVKEQIESGLRKTTGRYNKPAEAKLGKASSITLVLDGSADCCREIPFSYSGEKVRVTIDVSDNMSATLFGPTTDVIITPRSSEKQRIVPGRQTEWTWEVVPKTTDPIELTLQIFAWISVRCAWDENRVLDIPLS